MPLFSRRRRHISPTVSPQAPATPPSKMTVFGKQFYTDTPYVLAKGGKIENERLDFQHFLLTRAMRGLFHAPIATDAPLRIIDVGCGTGVWAAEMAYRYPTLAVVAFDRETPPLDEREQQWQQLSEQEQVNLFIQGAEPRHRPTNYHFLKGDLFAREPGAEAGAMRLIPRLPFDDNTFDFTFQRLLIGGIPTALFPSEVAELARITKPGGWIELVEAKAVVNGGPAITQLSTWGKTVSAMHKIDIDRADDIADYLQQQHFLRLHTERVKIPYGRQRGLWYDQSLSRSMAQDYITVIKESMRPLILQYHLAAAEEFDQAVAQAYREVNVVGGAYVPFTWAIGQKP